MNIVVVGGKGLVGRNVVERLQAEGHNVQSASRSTGVDLMTGRGLEESLAGAEVVVDVSNSPTYDDIAAFEFFETAIINLLEAEVRAGVKHHIALSVVGTERLGSSASHYFRGKALQDNFIRTSGIPYTIVHATQFYEFLVAIIHSAVRDQVVHLSPAYIQPVASDDVAAAITKIATGAPLNGSIELAGPERERMSELIQRFVLDMEAPCEIYTDVRAPYFGATLDEFTLLPQDGCECGKMGFQAWLAQSEFSRVSW